MKMLHRLVQRNWHSVQRYSQYRLASSRSQSVVVTRTPNPKAFVYTTTTRAIPRSMLCHYLGCPTAFRPDNQHRTTHLCQWRSSTLGQFSCSYILRVGSHTPLDSGRTSRGNFATLVSSTTTSDRSGYHVTRIIPSRSENFRSGNSRRKG